jgi:hypothetical protein
MLQSSLLSLRLRLQCGSTAPSAEPVLRVGTTHVAALWECGCASVGENFNVMTFIPCSAAHERLTAQSAAEAPLPSRDQVRSELRANSFPTAPPPAIKKHSST